MASANFDALHLKLSRRIADPVAAAGTNGTECSSALRTDYLNRANRMNQQMVLAQGPEAISRLLPGLIATDTTATSSGSRSLPSDYAFHVAFQKVSGARATFVPARAKADLDQNSNPNMDLAYTIVGGTLYAYDGGVAIANGSHILYYMKTDQRASSGDSADISIDAWWWDTLLALAAHLFYADKGDSQRSAQALQEALSGTSMVMGNRYG